MNVPVVDRLAGLRVVVTGGASGIGRATCELLLARGAYVLLVDRDLERLAAVAAQLEPLAGRPVPYARCDVRQAADCNRMADDAEEALDGIDALVHCAGVLRPSGGRPRPLYELSDDEYDLVVGTNLKGTFLVNRAILQKLLPQRAGQIVNLSSTSGRQGRPLDSVYSASKAGVIGLSESIAEEVRPFGIRVQVILPDAVDTPLWQQNGPLTLPPPGSLPPERVAEVIALCLALPPDMTLENIVIEPFRKRKTKTRAAGADAQPAEGELLR